MLSWGGLGCPTLPIEHEKLREELKRFGERRLLMPSLGRRYPEAIMNIYSLMHSAWSVSGHKHGNMFRQAHRSQLLQ